VQFPFPPARERRAASVKKKKKRKSSFSSKKNTASRNCHINGITRKHNRSIAKSIGQFARQMIYSRIGALYFVRTFMNICKIIRVLLAPAITAICVIIVVQFDARCCSVFCFAHTRVNRPPRRSLINHNEIARCNRFVPEITKQHLTIFILSSPGSAPRCHPNWFNYISKV